MESLTESLIFDEPCFVEDYQLSHHHHSHFLLVQAVVAVLNYYCPHQRQ
ncbi:hypothetical protein A2U01_0082935, partial [Trifolium medium]|nr:hypothetical protein [Trifolium medium]